MAGFAAHLIESGKAAATLAPAAAGTFNLSHLPSLKSTAKLDTLKTVFVKA